MKIDHSTTSVNRTNKNLTTFPQDIIESNQILMPNLSSLFLSSNKIQNIPEELGNVNNLWWLKLDNNVITELPTSIGNLKQLEIINLSNNRISKLPLSIKNWQKIEKIDFSYNLLTKIPDYFGFFPNLRVLNIRNNKLTNLPKTIENAILLDELDITNNNFPESYRLPPKLCKNWKDGDIKIITEHSFDHFCNVKLLKSKKEKSIYDSTMGGFAGLIFGTQK